MSAAPANIAGSPPWWMRFLLGRGASFSATPMVWWTASWEAGNSARFSWLKLAPSILLSYFLIPLATVPLGASTGLTWLAIPTTGPTQPHNGGIRTYSLAQVAPRDRTSKTTPLIAQPKTQTETRYRELAALATPV